MPTSATYQYKIGRVDPVINPDDTVAEELVVKVAASSTLVAGTLMGEVTATPGTYKAYASGNVDGSQIPRGILVRDTTTDGSGNITNLDWGLVSADGAPIYTSGTFDTRELTGLDANAVLASVGFARLIEGTVAAGIVRLI